MRLGRAVDPYERSALVHVSRIVHSVLTRSGVCSLCNCQSSRHDSGAVRCRRSGDADLATPIGRRRLAFATLGEALRRPPSAGFCGACTRQFCHSAVCAMCTSRFSQPRFLAESQKLILLRRPQASVVAPVGAHVAARPPASVLLYLAASRAEDILIFFWYNCSHATQCFAGNKSCYV